MGVKEIDINQPNDGVIAALERLLEEARSGEIQSIGYVVSYRGNWTSNGWAGMGTNAVRMVGELTILQHELLNAGAVAMTFRPVCYDD